MPENKIFEVRNLARLAVVAALYAALTLALPGISFGLVQFRFSEILVLLCFYRRDYSAALIVGCFIANCFSPMALMDMLFGTLATAIAVLPMYSVKNIWLASLLPVISNAVIIAIELFIAFDQPVWLGMLTVGLGELVVITIVGCPLFRFIVEKNSGLVDVLGMRRVKITYDAKR